MDEFNYFITTTPDHPRAVEAWEEKGFLQWAVLEDYPAGIHTFLDFVAAYPASPDAAGKAPLRDSSHRNVAR